MNITYREAKRILDKQEEAREVINSYRGMETLGKRLQLNNNKELILKLFEIEEDESIIEVFTHLKALYEEQWGDAEATAPPVIPAVPSFAAVMVSTSPTLGLKSTESLSSYSPVGEIVSGSTLCAEYNGISSYKILVVDVPTGYESTLK